MDKQTSRSKRKLGTTEYCYVCMAMLTQETGRVLLRPIKPLGFRTTIPLVDQRYTMCNTDAAIAIKDGAFAKVEETSVT